MEPSAPESGNQAVERSLNDCLDLFLAGRLDEARECLGRCISIDPGCAPAYSARAGVLQRLGKYREALDDISQALTLRPDDAGYLHNRAVVLTSLGRQTEAIRDYQRVLRLEPSSAGTLNNLAWLLSTSRDPALRDCRKAIDYARRAVTANRSGAWLDTLAAAHAECGDFERAVEIEAEAYALSQPPNQAFKKRLELYRRGISYANWIAGR